MPFLRSLLRPLFLSLIFTLSARAQMTWSLASGNESWPADKRTAIINAMTAAVNLYNANGYFPKTLWANYNASVPTAQASYSGWIDFGGSISTRVALHEISHTLGVGQVTAWNTNRSGNTWTGTFAKNRVKLFDGAAATLNADSMHFWPYGLNYDYEDGTTIRIRHIKMVSAMRRDMGIVEDKDTDGIPDDWEMFHFGNLNQSATGDADGDSVSNLAEYNADTDPTFATLQWTGATSSDWTTTTNWSSTVAATSGTYSARLNVNNATNHPLIYDATRGTTILRPTDRGLVIGSGTGGGAMSITGGSLSTVGSTAPDVIGNSGNTASLTIDGGSFASDELQFGVNGTGTGTLTVNSGSAAITTLAYRFGTGGSGTIQLNGGTLTTAGFVKEGSGTATLILNGGILRASTSSTTFLTGLSNAFIQSGGFGIDTSTQSITISQALKNDPSSPGGGLTKSGTGTLILSAANTYTGSTQVTAGILQASHATALGSSAAGVSVANTATLALSNQITTPAAESATISGVGAGSRGALQSASGTNTWNGPVSVAASGTRIGVQDGAALILAGNITETTAATALIFRAGLNSGNDITLSATGNAWSGTTSLFSGSATGGAIKLGTSNAIPTATVIQIAGRGVHGRLDLNGFHQTAAGLTHSTSGSSAIGDGIVTNTAATQSTLTLNLPTNTTQEFIGDIQNGSGGIQLAKLGSGTQTLSGTNSYTGNTEINEGTLVAASNSALGISSGPTSVASGATLRLAHGVTITGKTITLSGTGGSSTVGNFSGALQAAQNASAIWTGPVILGDAAARIGAFPGGTLEISGPISGSGSFQSLTIGAGTGGKANVILSAPSGSNSYTGTTAIIRGTLILGAPNTLPTSTILDIDTANANEDAILDLNGHPQTVAGLQRTNTSGGTGASILTNSHATHAVLTIAQDPSSTFSGILTGNFSLVKSGSGTLNLTSTANTYSGNTTISAGRLAVASAFLANTSHVSIANDAQLTLNFSGSDTVATLTLGSTQVPVGTYNSSHPIYGSFFSGTGSLIVTSGPALTPFESWMNSFQSLSANQKLPTADPDSDGINNLLEYVLNGSPTLPDNHILPAVSVTTTHAVFTFTRREESASTTSQIFEYGSNLETWTPVQITSPTAPEVSLGPIFNGSRTVTIQIPIQPGAPLPLFGRLRITTP